MPPRFPKFVHSYFLSAWNDEKNTKLTLDFRKWRHNFISKQCPISRYVLKRKILSLQLRQSLIFVFFHRKSTFSLKSHANVQFAEEDFGVWSDCTLIATPKKDHFWEKGPFKNHVGKFSETPFPVLGKFLWNRAFLCSKVVFGYLSTVSRGLCTAPRAANSIASSACISCTLSL